MKPSDRTRLLILEFAEKDIHDSTHRITDQEGNAPSYQAKSSSLVLPRVLRYLKTSTTCSSGYRRELGLTMRSEREIQTPSALIQRLPSSSVIPGQRAIKS